MKYLGDYDAGSTARFSFNTQDSTGSAITLAGTPAISVYKSGSTTEVTTGVTLTVDYDSRVGYHHVIVDMSSDGTFYAVGSDYRAVITAGTVNGISVVGKEVAHWSCRNRSAKAIQVGTGTGQINLSSGKAPATIAAGDIATDAITAASIAAGAIGSTELADGAITAAKFAAGAIDATAIATDAIGSNEISAAAVTKIQSGIPASIWDYATSAMTTAGSVGKWLRDLFNGITSLSTELDQIDSAIAALPTTLAGQTVVVASPVIVKTSGGLPVSIEIVQGADYRNANSTPITLTLSGTFPVWTGGTPYLDIDCGVSLSVAGTMVTATGSTRVMRFDLTATQTATLTDTSNDQEDIIYDEGFFDARVVMSVTDIQKPISKAAFISRRPA